MAAAAALPSIPASKPGGNCCYDVMAFGAVGDGLADDSPAINRAVAAAVPGGGIVHFPPGTYRLLREVALIGARNVTFLGYGATLELAPSARFGLALSGENRRVYIRGLRIVGTGNTADDQCGIGTTVHPVEGTRTVELCVADCEIERVARGVYVNVSGARHGDARRIRIDGNVIHDVVGTDSGQGYGIGLSGCWYSIVAHNHLERVQRHSIYNSVSRFTVISGNTVRHHRRDAATGSQLSALVTARSSYVSITDNCLEACADGALSIEPHETEIDHVSRGISVLGNKFVDSCHQDIIIGTTNPAAAGPLIDVVVANNVFQRPPDPTNGKEAVRIFNGKRIRITGNHFGSDAPFGAQYCYIVLSGTPDPTHTDHVTIDANSASLSVGGGASAGLVELAAGLCTGRQRITVGRNDLTIDGSDGAPVLFGTLPVTSPAVSVDQSPGFATLAYGSVVQSGLGGNRFCRLVITDRRDFLIEPPQMALSGLVIQYDIVNERTSRPGRMRWSGAFRLASKLSTPGPGRRRTITFYCDGRDWVEIGRSASDL